MLAFVGGLVLAWGVAIYLTIMILRDIRTEIKSRPAKAKAAADKGAAMTKEQKINTVQERVQ